MSYDDGDILGLRRRPTEAQPAAPSSPSTPKAKKRCGGSSSAPATAPFTPFAAHASHATAADPIVPDYDQLNPEERRRYKASQRSRFKIDPIREIILDRAAPTLLRSLESGQGTGELQEISVTAVASMAKQFVRDLVEKAKRTQLERGGSGPLNPSDILEARKTLAEEGKGPPLRLSASRGQGRLVPRGNGPSTSLLGGGGVLRKGNAI